jgi:hypothetical protein
MVSCLQKTSLNQSLPPLLERNGASAFMKRTIQVSIHYMRHLPIYDSGSEAEEHCEFTRTLKWGLNKIFRCETMLKWYFFALMMLHWDKVIRLLHLESFCSLYLVHFQLEQRNSNRSDMRIEQSKRKKFSSAQLRRDGADWLARHWSLHEQTARR